MSRSCRSFTTRLAILAIPLCLLVGCRREATPATTLPQRAYVWQREWNPHVVEAIQRSHNDLAGYVILACEVEWVNGKARPVIPKVDWKSIKNTGGSVSPAIRIMPFAGPFAGDDDTARILCEIARLRIAEIRAAGIEPAELQLDFDCAQSKLSDYAMWVRAIRRAITPLPLVITTLPCWLDEPGFPDLARTADAFVLQVHSIPSPLGDEKTMVCDPALARTWVARASRIGVPFEISLPTYRTLAGYDATGKKLGSYSDAVRPAWPPGTIVREFATDLDAMAALAATWQSCLPAHCTGLIWYRLPVEGDHNNCPWPALRAMTQGRSPSRAFEVHVNGKPSDQISDPLTLIDLSLTNTGESEDVTINGLTVRWNDPVMLKTAEPLSGWRITRGDHNATFTPMNAPIRLTHGFEHAIAWMRFDQPASVHVEILH